ncbi:MAG: ankyrin repeat domain-containing protein [Bacteroidales bacterium]|nr:ankyrin repeat domain-containing protein [Bacteroidales bacterium]
MNRPTTILICLLFTMVGQAMSQGKVLILPDTVYIYSDPDYELLVSALEGDTLRVKAFLELGADVNTTSYNGITPLMYAAQEGHLRTVEILIDSGANINTLPENHISALLGATIAGHVYVVDTLILNGAYINTTSSEGVTPVMVTAAYGYPVIADLLLFYGADLSMKDYEGNTALHYGTYYNDFQISELFIKKGADVNATDLEGFTPLMIAAQYGYTGMADLLIQNGADPSVTNENNLNALSLAVIMRRYETADYLIHQGADVNHNISENINQMTLAGEYGDKTIQKMLLENGAVHKRNLWWKWMSVGLDINGNADDFMLGGQITLFESNYGFELLGGYKTRPWTRSVLYETNDPNVLYQFWEKRSVINLGIEKSFEIYRYSFYDFGGIAAGINGAYSYGNFRGSDKKPDDKFLFIPTAGLFWNFNRVNVKVSYEYMKLKNTKVSPHRYNVAFSYKFNLSKNKITLKSELPF